MTTSKKALPPPAPPAWRIEIEEIAESSGRRPTIDDAIKSLEAHSVNEVSRGDLYVLHMLVQDPALQNELARAGIFVDQESDASFI